MGKQNVCLFWGHGASVFTLQGGGFCEERFTGFLRRFKNLVKNGYVWIHNSYISRQRELLYLK